MRLIMLGVRGSTPAPGPEFVRYGGHTSCVAVVPEGSDVPTLVLDAGTGLRSLSAMLNGGPFLGSILLSHLHWDHMQGIPFFVAGDRPDAQVDVYLPAQDGRDGHDLLAQAMAPPAFPITPDGLQGRWTFTALEPGTRLIGGIEVTAAEVRHKGGRTFAYRLADATGSMAYVPDHVVSEGVDDRARALLADVDVMLHDAQFVESERTLADAYGHSTVDDAILLGKECGVRRVVLFHHGPARTDDALDALRSGLDYYGAVTVAAQGDVIDLAAH